MGVHVNSIAVMFLSFLCGIVGDAILKKHPGYGWLSTRYLFRNSRSYEVLGIRFFQSLMLKTPLGSFNRRLIVTADRSLQTLETVRREMATAEVSHWVGFVVMFAVTIGVWFKGGGGFVIGSYVILNVFGNVYPAMLQQYNKRRLERLIELTRRREVTHG